MKRVWLLVMGLLMAACGSALATGEASDKVFVCKYVSTPGEGERLQTGDNPISVSVNAIPLGDVRVGSEFADAQGRSVVIAFDIGQPEPPATDCPPPNDDPPPTTSTSTTEPEGDDPGTTTSSSSTTTTCADCGINTVVIIPTTTTTVAQPTTTVCTDCVPNTQVIPGGTTTTSTTTAPVTPSTLGTAPTTTVRATTTVPVTIPETR